MDEGTAAITIATVALVPAIYASALPPIAAVRATQDQGGHLSAAETYAALLAGAVVLGIAGATRSPQAAGAGLVAVVGYAAAYRIAHDVTP